MSSNTPTDTAGAPTETGLQDLDPTQGEDTQWPDEAKVVPDAYLEADKKT